MASLEQSPLIGADDVSAIDPETLLQHFNRAQSLARTGSWELDISSGNIIWSTQIFVIFGLSPQSFRPTYPAFLERVHPDDRAMVEERVGLALEGVQDYALDHRIVLSDGSVRIVREQAEVERDAEGRPVRMTGAVQDVTDIRAAEEAARRSEETLAAMLRISPEAIVVADASGHILAFSVGAEETFGYRADEVVGKPVDLLFPARLRKHHAHHVRNFAAGAVTSLRMHDRSVILGLRKNGEEFPAEASLAKLETPNGYAFTAIVRDLSSQRNAELRLIEARELAEKASLAKSTFLANMSHEIRTPLNGVLGVAGALARTGLTSRQMEMVRLIESSGRALEGLLSDILDLAKVDAGRMSVRAEPFDLGAVVRDTVALFHASAAEKGVDLLISVDEASRSHFTGDDLKIRQVLSNLLSNAVKFTAHGDVRLSVICACSPTGRERVRFVVKDTGIGFAKETADSLFERFEQADGSITRQYGGTGLGLAISKSLVALMGGTISASAEEGRGATFAFEIPLLRAGAVPAPIGGPADTLAERRDRPVKILLAEDHAVNRLAVELILETLPVQLASVENGWDAVQAFETDRFDLIFMDMQMPVMDGLEAIRRIREREFATGRRRTPICVLTANAMVEHKDSAENAGADSFLTKPIDAQALVDMVLGVPLINEAEDQAA